MEVNHRAEGDEDESWSFVSFDSFSPHFPNIHIEFGVK